MSSQRDEKIRCDACPVMCYIADGKSGACDRYANHDGQIVRLDPLTILDRRMEAGDSVKPFLGANWDGGTGGEVFVTAIGAGTTYPVTSRPPSSSAANWTAGFRHRGDRAIFSYCGVKVKIDTDRHLGKEGAVVPPRQANGLVITSEYGSQMSPAVSTI